MINRVTQVGRLTRDPDLKFLANGTAVCNFGIAVNRPFKNQQGENEADFFNVTAWRKQAENVANHLKKGQQVGIDGRLQSRKYQNQEGKNVTVVEIQAESVQFLESKGNKSQTEQKDAQQAQSSAQDNNTDPFANNGQEVDIGDELPF